MGVNSSNKRDDDGKKVSPPGKIKGNYDARISEQGTDWGHIIEWKRSKLLGCNELDMIYYSFYIR